MLRLILLTSYVLAVGLAANAQTPGVDPHGLAGYDGVLIIGASEGVRYAVIRPDKAPKVGRSIRQPNGTYIDELPKISPDYQVGYIFRVRVEEVLKPGRSIHAGQVIEILARHRYEGALSLPPKQRFLLALAPFEPKKEDFVGTSVLLVVAGAVTEKGVPFDIRMKYYTVPGESDGSIEVTDRTRQLIEEIKSAVHKAAKR